MSSDRKPPESLQAAIDAKRSDPDYMDRLRRHVDENRVVLDRLADESVRSTDEQ